MSITSDIRAKADSAFEQGRSQLTNALGVLDQAQSQLTDVTEDVAGRVNGLATKATETVGDLRAQAEKAIDLDAIRSAVEPYLAQAKEYRNAVTDRASSFVGTVTSDKRVAKVVDTAESISGVVVGTVTQRVIKPVQDLTGRSKATVTTPRTRTATKTSPAKPAKAASTRPAPKPATKAAKPATKPATKPAAKATTARKAPAKSATKTTGSTATQA